MLYIAYGSNMDRDRIAARCPSAQLVGPGWLDGWQLAFKSHTPGRAYATLERPLPGKRGRVPVAVWRLADADEAVLDQFEGHPLCYRKAQASVTLVGGRTVHGLMYLMNSTLYGMPHTQYLTHIVKGYHELGFGRYVNTLLAQAVRAAQVWCDQDWRGSV